MAEREAVEADLEKKSQKLERAQATFAKEKTPRAKKAYHAARDEYDEARLEYLTTFGPEAGEGGAAVTLEPIVGRGGVQE